MEQCKRSIVLRGLPSASTSTTSMSIVGGKAPCMKNSEFTMSSDFAQVEYIYIYICVCLCVEFLFNRSRAFRQARFEG